jgi:hypothetical protein
VTVTVTAASWTSRRTPWRAEPKHANQPTNMMTPEEGRQLWLYIRFPCPQQERSFRTTLCISLNPFFSSISCTSSQCLLKCGGKAETQAGRCSVFTCPWLCKKIVIPTCCISVCHSVPLLFGDWSGKPAPVYLPRY